jgi:hypothetical protein
MQTGRLKAIGSRGFLLLALIGFAPAALFAADELDAEDPFDPKRPLAAELEARRVAEIRLHPIDLGYGRRLPDSGVPRLASKAKGRPILERLREISAPYETKISIEKNVGVIRS